MSERELENLYFINAQIKKLEETIERIESSTIGTRRLDGMPKGSGFSDHVGKMATELAFLKGKLLDKWQEFISERERLETILDGIDDAEIRIIFRLRHIEFMDWRSIGFELQRDHSWAVRKYKKYLGSHEI